MRIAGQAWFSAAMAAVALAPGVSAAQIRTDSSLGRAAQALAGPQFTIPETLGSLRGSNLFHSFSVFNIATGESASFTTTTRGIGNVVSRVTGGDPSLINGTLRLTPADGTPGFYFINPAGVTFGAGASIDVPGAFHVSTADYVKFADGVFHADANAASTLSSAAPEAFGFLGANRAAINVNGGARLSTALLQPFSIAAGDVTFDNGRATTRSGEIRVVALGSRAAEVGFRGSLPAAAGELRILNGGQISSPVTSSTDGGSVAVSAGSILIDRQASRGVTGILSQANTGTSGDAGSLDINATGNVRIVNGGVISTSAFSSGDGGSVSVTADNLTIDSQGSATTTGIFSNASPGSTGNAGAVFVTVNGLLSIVNGGEIGSGAFRDAADAGTVVVRAGNLVIDRRGSATPTGVFSSANSGSAGNAGTVDIAVAGDISILDGGAITSNTSSAGDAGSVSVRASNILIDGVDGKFTGITSDTNRGATGNAGTVAVAAAGSLTILNGGTISSSTFSSGDAGMVSVSADSLSLAREGTIVSNTFDAGSAGSVKVIARSVRIDSQGTSPFLTGIASQTEDESSGNAGFVEVAVTGSLVIVDEGAISSSTLGTGNAGSVKVSAGNINMSHAALIVSDTFFSGRAGTVEVNAGNITIDGQGEVGGIFSRAREGSTGNAGSVDVRAAGHLSILNGGEIASSTFAAGDAGSVRVVAGTMTLDSQGFSGHLTGIASQAERDSTGNAGSIEVSVGGALSVLNGGGITSSTFSSGNAGSVRVVAESMTLDSQGFSRYLTGIASQAEFGSTGDAGLVEVTTSGQLSIYAGGTIASSTFASGKAGSVIVRAHDLLIDGRNHNASLTGVASQAEASSSGNAGNIEVTVKEGLVLRNGGAISSSTFSSGAGGRVSVSAGQVSIDRQGADNPTGILSQAYQGSTGDAGTVHVTVRESLEMLDGGVISSGTFGEGNAGAVRVRARDISMASPTTSRRAGIFSQAEAHSTGDGGTVEVSATGTLSIRNEGFIGSSTFGGGDAGSVTVDAGRLEINGEGFVTGIHSQAELGSTGNAGAIHVRVAGDLDMANRAQIASNTFATGNAGPIRVEAHNITIDGQGTRTVGSRATGTGIFSQAVYDSAGDAGTIDVVATGDLLLTAGGLISSTTQADGAGGAVRVSADNITIDGAISFSDTGIYSRAEWGRGNAGTVDVNAAGNLLINYGGLITSDTYSGGSGGAVSVSAANITIVGGEFAFVTGIASRATTGSYANAGSVDVTASEALSVLNGGQITSSTLAFLGSAGSVNVRAGSILVDGDLGFGRRSTITARAEGFSSGQTGNLTVAADRITLSNGGELSITNAGESGNPESIRPSLISVIAPVIELRDGGSITAASTGNVAASNIHVDVSSRMTLVNSAITTSAVDGNGGAITVVGDGVLALKDSQITTSVSGLRGNGGDISIGTASLVMDTGFIQANTAAADATGGNVAINVESLVPSGGSLFVGGRDPLDFRTGVFGLNVIQAAAPTGVSGVISITTPALDISGGLVGLSAKVLDTGGLGRSLCEMTGGSSLAQAGRGGMPPSARDFARVEDAASTRPLALAARVNRERMPGLECWR